MPNIFRTGRPTMFKLGRRTEHKTRISNKRRDQRSRSQGHVTRLTVSADMSRKKRRRNTKIGMKVAHLTRNNTHEFQGNRSRSPGRLMLRHEVHNIFRTGRPIRSSNSVETEHEDPHHAATSTWPPRSKVKVAMSRDASYRCWPILSRELNVLEIQKLVWRLCISCAIMRTSFKGHQQWYSSSQNHFSFSFYKVWAQSFQYKFLYSI